MEIDWIKRKNAQGTRHSVPTVSITKKGLISLNKQAVEILSLQERNMVAIGRDKHNPKDWYIVRTTDGYMLRKYAPYRGSLCFSASSLAEEIYNSLGNKENKTIRFAIAQQPTQYKDMILYAIITSKQL
ncbi:MAG TPA: hypothetical protein DCY35_03745 [Prolixibacteraceae bacterium]|nr:hypothetical protein [Prolixibacteraceae bacterium]